jgi:ADP-heptose:LPS heptosyltransferase
VTPSPRLVQVRRAAPVPADPAALVQGLRRLLVVPEERLGDLVLALPLVAALRDAYPAAWLGIMTRRTLTPLVSLVEGADEALAGTDDLHRLEGLLARFRPDLIVSVRHGVRLPWVARRRGVPHRVGPAGLTLSRLHTRPVAAHVGRRHEVERLFAVGRAAGAASGPARFPLRVPPSAQEAMAAWLAGHGIPDRFVAVHPGSGGSSPAWPPGHWVRLAALLDAEGCSVVLSVGPEDREAWARLDAAELRVRRLPRFTGDVSALAALLARATALVGNSSGPLHLAAALGTSTLAFHPPGPVFGPERRGPYAANGWALVSDPESNPWWRRGTRGLPPPLLETISPAAALACVLDLIEGRPPRLESA